MTTDWLDARGASSVTAIITMPVALLLFLLAVHGALLMYSRQVVNAAAHDALAYSQLVGATEPEGEELGRATLEQAPSLSNGIVDVDIGSRSVKVVVTAAFDSVLGDDFEVRAELIGPREIENPERERLVGT